MDRFRYKARNRIGQESSGEILAPNREDALAVLQETGLYVVTLSFANQRRRARRWNRRIILSLQDRIFLLDSWAMILHSGIPLQSSISRMATAIRHFSVQQALLYMQQLIGQGSLFSEAMAASRLFPLSWVGLFSAGEQHGDYIGPMRMLRERCQMLRHLKKEIISALLLPAVLMGMVFVWIWIFATYDVPAMQHFLISITGKLTFWMRVVIFVSDWIHQFFFWGLLAVLTLVLVGLRFSRSDQLISSTQRWIPYNFPGIGKIMQSSHQLILLSELHMQLAAGIPMVQAVESLTWSVSHPTLRRQLFFVAQQLDQGIPVPQAFISMDVFPGNIHTMIAIGDLSGKLPEILETQVKETRLNLKTEVERFAIWLRTIVMILSGIMVGVIFIAFMMLFLSSAHGAAQSMAQNSSAIIQSGI